MNHEPINNLTLTGEVIEICDSKDAHMVKIMCRPEFIMLYAEKSEHLRLGEQVIIAGNFQIKSLQEVQ